LHIPVNDVEFARKAVGMRRQYGGLRGAWFCDTPGGPETVKLLVDAPN
jgi:hypothetical protein